MIARWAPACRRLLSLLPCAALLVALVSPGTPLLARLIIVSLFGVTLWNPATGLLAAAGLAPLGAFVAALDGMADFRLTEVILLSFIAAWLLRPPPDRDQGPGTKTQGPRLPRYAWTAAWLFAVLIASLAVGLNTQLLHYPDALRTNLATVALHYFGYGDPTGISDCARMLEGFAIVGATLELFRRRPGLAKSLPVALALSAIAAAGTSILLWFGIGPRQILAREAVIGYRFSAHVLDLNAAGSHFAMVLCLALGIAMRERGRRRAFWIAAALACGVGLWMGRSRSAEAAVGLVIPMAVLWAATTAWPRANRLSLIGGVMSILLIVGAVRGRQIERDPTYTASEFRQQFVMSSFRVIGTHPYLGIGVGRYFRDSPTFLTPQLAWAYNSENAHNNYLQIVAEAGIIGFLLYAAWFAGALRPACVALARHPRDWRLLGSTAGIAVFLATCLTGHPLLVPEIAAAFFVQVALAASLGGSSLLHRPGLPDRRHAQTPVALWPALTVIGTVVFAVLPAWTLGKPLVPVHLEEVDGFYYGDEGTVDGVPFHWTREYASLFAPNTARAVDLALRSPLAAITKEPTLVEIRSGDTLVNALVDDKWSRVTLNLVWPEPPLLFSRINLKVNHTARVSQLTPGSKDERVVGIQVGDLRILVWEFVPKFARARASP
jgi:O-antigen ligase